MAPFIIAMYQVKVDPVATLAASNFSSVAVDKPTVDTFRVIVIVMLFPVSDVSTDAVLVVTSVVASVLQSI